MWRSNVLRLRNYSSTAPIRHGVNTRWYGSERSLPVTEKEFERALAKVLKWKWGTESKTRLGFAISGGVDSMALAALYSQAQAVNLFLPKAHGFIVDHKVRPESTEEAEWVAQQLRAKFGMESTVLSLTWPEDFNPTDLTRFETEARTLRYQALGRACRDKKITSLMVAHHGDDQAETVLMRLANNRLRSGLQAMHNIDWIPECEGIYGIHHSGKIQSPDTTLNIPFPVEQGGIQILRPLLSFEKSRLIASCEEKGVVWAEDKTNQIQTLTSRNAIRHIYKNHRLPEALSIKSLVDVSLNMQKRMESHKAYAKRLFDQCLIKLDIQTGCLIVRFPPFSALLARPIATDSDKKEAKNNAYCLIERVAEIISPRSKAPLGQLAATIDRIYPEFGSPDDGEFAPGSEHLKTSYSVFSVWWRFWDKPTPFVDDIEAGLDPVEPHPREWLLTRQPLDAAERTSRASHIIYSPSRTKSLNSHSSASRDTYQLFDGRFWIHLRNLTDDTLIIRIFEKTDFRHFPTSHQERQDSTKHQGDRPYRYISAAFDLLKPSDLRFTLPVVFRKDSATGEETLVGFPTLNVRMHGFGAPKGVCEWSVRYKKIDFGNRSAGDIIVPGYTKEDITAEEKRQRVQNNGIIRLKQRMDRVPGADSSFDNDPFTGYKRVSDRKSNQKVKRRKPQDWARKQRVMEGEEEEGLGFLKDETAKQAEKERQSKDRQV